MARLLKIEVDGRPRYVFDCQYGEHVAAQQAGFYWDKEGKKTGTPKAWWTNDETRALQLIDAADEELAKELEAIEKTGAELLSLSRATEIARDYPSPPGLDYLPFQKAGIDFALKLSELGRRGCLIGDEMGLGKTIQAVGFVNASPAVKNVLVLCPASLKINWQRELSKWLVRDYAIEIIEGGGASPAMSGERNVVIINYDVLARNDWLYDHRWDALIIDEVHYLKNPKAQRTKAVFGGRGQIGVSASFVLALTGTPIPNRPIEARGVLQYLDPDFAEWRWKRYALRYCAAHQTRFGWDVSGAANLEELQHHLRTRVLVRRLKADVLTELPAKRRQIIELPASVCPDAFRKEQEFLLNREKVVEEIRRSIPTEGAEGYADAVERLKEAQQVLFEEMARVRHATAVAKAPAVADQVISMLTDEGVDKVIVFAHHKDVIAVLKGRFAKAFGDGATVELTGSTSMANRAAAVDAFQEDPSVRIFVGNIQAAGVGITLTAASTVVFAELDWVPGNISQAEDRAHRIGQDDSVLVQHIVLEESLDARIANTVVSKQRVIDRALNRTTTKAPEKIEIPKPIAEKIEIPKPIDDGLDPEVVDALRRSIQYLARLDPDRAREENNAGFNKYDGEFGHSLAEQPSWSPRQQKAAKKLMKKYRRQMDPDDYALIYDEPTSLETPLSKEDVEAMDLFLSRFDTTHDRYE